MRRLFRLAPAILLLVPLSAFGCEEGVVLSEHLPITSPADFYVVHIQRAHGANLVGTIQRAFGGGLAEGQTVSIQLVQPVLAGAGCALNAVAGETWLLEGRLAGGALQVARFNSHNLPAAHERFAAYVGELEAASALLSQP